MPYIKPEIVAQAREMDLLTWLKNYEPQELVHFSGNTYCTKEHDSLKISNGKWYWFSRGFGGRSALDYLVKVKGIPFMEAVGIITGKGHTYTPVHAVVAERPTEKMLLLPERCQDTGRVTAYLSGRGIDRELIAYCIETRRLYESLPYHNAVFVGHDRNGKARYASLRGTKSDFKGDAEGSDKRYSFNIPAKQSDTLLLFESAIDLLSYATLQKVDGADQRSTHLVSLSGVYRPKTKNGEITMPLALTQYLDDYPGIRKITLCLDNDFAGRSAMAGLQKALSTSHEVWIVPPPCGKDYNDYLRIKKGIKTRKARAGPKER